LGLSLLGCPTDGGDDGGGSGGGSIDTTKLIGNWVNDNGTIDFQFGPVVDTPIGKRISNYAYEINKAQGGGTLPINGDILGDDDDTFRVAFEGEKLKIFEGKGKYSVCNGLYTKQP
jgi:hypothetical protein